MTQILLYPWASLTVERMQQETPVLLHEMFDLEDKSHEAAGRLARTSTNARASSGDERVVFANRDSLTTLLECQPYQSTSPLGTWTKPSIPGGRCAGKRGVDWRRRRWRRSIRAQTLTPKVVAVVVAVPLTVFDIPASVLGGTESVTVGTAAAGSANNGVAGTIGTNTVFGTGTPSWAKAGGGVGGSGTGGGNGGSGTEAGAAGGAGGASGANAGSTPTAPTGRQAAGGGGGGGKSSGGQANGAAGAVAGANTHNTALTAGSGGTSAGQSGNVTTAVVNVTANYPHGGSGGGGGAGNSGGVGGTGGVGGKYGGGGGGGGGGTNGNPGPGGSGAIGICVVVTAN
jgi:hypothetical protein